jgi:nitrate reductase NapA
VEGNAEDRRPGRHRHVRSGQWTIFEGYAATKLWKAGFRSNNLDPNARHCMASAVTGFMRTFGIDEPMGCYDDIEQADAFVLWGSNMAEMHPVLWSRITDRRLSSPHVKVAVLSTLRAPQLRPGRQRPDLPAADRPGDPELHRPLPDQQQEGEHRVRQEARQLQEGRRRHRLRPAPGHALEKDAKSNGYAGADGKPKGNPNDSTPITFDEFAKFVSEYTAEKVSQLSGVPVKQLEDLAKLYADPKTKVMSLWTMGFNQHTRGTWANNMVYNIHLLTGKISQPGNSPFSLTGQPSACGTAREVGTFAHRLPADMVVTNPEHRKHTEEIWQLPPGTINDKIGLHAVAQSRALKDGKLKCYWTSTTNNMQAGPNINGEILPGWRNPATFVVVSDCYPTVSAMAADLILPSAMWVEKEGAFGNAERRTQFWRQQVPARARPSDLWQYIEFSKRFKMEEVWPAELLAKKPEYKGKTMFDVLYKNGKVNKYPVADLTKVNAKYIKDYTNDESKALRLLPAEGPVRGIRRVRPRPRPRPGRVRRLPRGARPALAGGRRQGNAVALPRRLRPLREEGRGHPLLRQQGRQGQHLRAALPARRREPRQGLRPVAVHRPRAGALAHRQHDAPRGRAAPRRARGRAVHAPRRRQARGIQRGMQVKVMSRRGEIEVSVETKGRNKVPRGLVFVPFFDEGRLVNKLTLDATCPISQGDRLQEVRRQGGQGLSLNEQAHGPLPSPGAARRRHRQHAPR